MSCERGSVKLDGVTVDIVIGGPNQSIEKQCLIEDNPGQVNIISSVESGSGDIVFIADTTFIYPYGFLARLTKHFADPKVVAVSGMRSDNPYAWWAALWGRPMYYGLSAFKRSAYTGLLDTTPEQGKYVFEPRAVVKF